MRWFWWAFFVVLGVGMAILILYGSLLGKL